MVFILNCSRSLDLDEESHNNYDFAMLIAFFFIPTYLLTLIYGAIAVTLKRRQRQRKNMSKSETSRDHSSNRKIIGLSVAILAGFIIFIGPFVVWHLIMILTCEFIIKILLFHS